MLLFCFDFYDVHFAYGILFFIYFVFISIVESVAKVRPVDKLREALSSSESFKKHYLVSSRMNSCFFFHFYSYLACGYNSAFSAQTVIQCSQISVKLNDGHGA